MGFLLNTPTLRITASAPHMAIDHVYALDNHMSSRHVDVQHLAARTLVVPADHLNCIVLTNVYCHSIVRPT